MARKMFLLLFLVSATMGFSQNLRDFTVRVNGIGGERGITIVGYSGKAKNVIIPAVINGLQVTAIGDQAFMNRGLTTVLIPDGIVNIGRQAFFGNQLTDVVLPRSVREIGAAAFDSNRMASVYRNHYSADYYNNTIVVEQTTTRDISANGTTISNEIIINVPDQTKPPVKASDAVSSDEEATGTIAMNENKPEQNASEKNTPEVKEKTPEKIIEESNYEFNIGSVSPPPGKNMTPASNGVFYLQDRGNGTASVTGYTSSYKDIIIPSSMGNLTVSMIGNGAFMDKKLRSVIIPSSVTYISNAAFSGNQIESIIIPDSVRFIGYQAFSGSQLRSITIGSGVIVQADSFLADFAYYYNLYGQKAGTYLYTNRQWSFTNLEDVRYVY
jgi:hypothetical protein